MPERTQPAEDGLTSYVAEFVNGTRLEDIPDDVALAKKSILDGCGLALSGSVAKSGELIRRLSANSLSSAGWPP